MVTCCVFGFFFHKFCNPRKCSPTTRHTLSFCVGYLIAFLCYGVRSGHLLAMSSTVYLLLHIFSPKRAFWTSFLFCLTYSSWAHLYRMKFDYGGYSADVSLPLMVLVQRLTLLTANLLDGHEMVSESKRESDNKKGSVHSNGHPSKDLIIPRLTPIRKEYAVLKVPTPVEFFSYCINFQTVLAGPPLAFKDYKVYIEGTEVDDKHLTVEQRAKFIKNRDTLLQPMNEILKYFLQAVAFLLVYLCICQFFRPSFYLSEAFGKFEFFHKCFYLMFTGFTMRQHYYFAWSVCALSCLAAGFGFHGFDKNGKPDYSLVKSFNFMEAEFPRSIKELMDNWNLQTLRWLRITIFDRTPKSIAVFAVFFVSVLWHGFYPGYYLFFVSMAWFSVIGRMIRKRLRPRILEWLPDTKWVWTPGGQREGTSRAYDLITRIVTYFLVNYTALAFVILSFRDSIVAWSRFGYAGHLLCLVAQLLMLTLMPPSKSTPLLSASRSKKVLKPHIYIIVDSNTYLKQTPSLSLVNFSFLHPSFPCMLYGPEMSTGNVSCFFLATNNLPVVNCCFQKLVFLLGLCVLRVN
uniref:O acyltransferase membrane bound domain n=1 Tax=Echinococcus granulosus TaxID=6210 RepID=A0A068X4C9_ECHGR|nr:o acyltransferase membrane bound domain [Echinococcus granulosus]